MSAVRTKRQVGDAGAKVVEEAANTQVATFGQLRLPYHDVFKERFDVDKGTYKVLIEAIWPAAKTVDAIALALSYCKARNLDPLKRVVHIVPMWNSALGATVETVWPGIAELRTTAFRTGDYAGIDAVELGPMVEIDFEGKTRGREPQTLKKTVTVPEWARFTVYRMIKGMRCAFVGPKVFWEETFADVAGSGVPNEMWADRPQGQIEKCAEAAALRRAFPEELGSMYAAEEMDGRQIAAAAAVGAEVAQVEKTAPETAKSTGNSENEPVDVDFEPPAPRKPVDGAKASPGKTEGVEAKNEQAKPAQAAPAQKKRHLPEHSAILRDAMLTRIAACPDKEALAKWKKDSAAEIDALTESDHDAVLDAAENKLISFDEQPE